MSGLVMKQAESARQVDQARELFLEYGQSLGFSLCFQGFDKELAELPGDYAPPDGRLLLAEFEGQLAGCVALHKLEERFGFREIAPYRVNPMPGTLYMELDL
jgi:hypothetical protein